MTKAPACPGLSFTLCVLAGTEPGGKCGDGRLVTTPGKTALWQVSTRRVPVAGRALTLLLAGHLVLQRKRADCGTASPVIAALCGQDANRQSEHERDSGDDYAFGHQGVAVRTN
jgi:hypothetical protein